MKLELRLIALERQADRRLARLIGVLPAPGVVDASADRRVAFITIEALNVWMGFARHFYLGCALGARDCSGKRVVCQVPNMRSVDDALTFAVHTAKPELAKRTAPWSPGDEPVWHQVSQFAKVMQALQPSNLDSVNAAISLTTNAFRHLPTFRNFYAHRGASTALKAQRTATDYLLSAKLHPTRILLSYAPGRPLPVLHEWIEDLRAVVALMP